MIEQTQQALQHCLQRIEHRLGWGPVEAWSGADFEALSERILEATGVRLSPTTLKRVWGRIHYTGTPSPTTLDALAVFAGADNWRSLRTTVQTGSPAKPNDEVPPEVRSPRRAGWWLAGVAGIALVLVVMLSGAQESPPRLDPADFSFSARPLARGFPNSVVFDYQASAASTDSVFIQQSWDANRRIPVARTGRSHTAIYYEPGFFRAKLVVGSQVVREEPLFVPSEKWVVAAYPAGDDIPVYFDPARLAGTEPGLTLRPDQLRAVGLSLQPYPPRVRFSFVDTLPGWSSHHLDLGVELRHTFYDGATRCQYTRLIVLLEDDAIIVPLSQPGCVANLSLYAPGLTRNGSTADLSAFGTDLRKWNRLHLRSQDGYLRIQLNDRTIFTDSLPGTPKPLVGLRLEFTGTGAARSVLLGARELIDPPIAEPSRVGVPGR